MSERVRPLDLLRRSGRNAAVAVRRLASPLFQRVPREWIVVRLDRGLADVPPPPGIGLWGARRMPVLPSLLEVFERAADDAAVHGVFVRIGAASLGWTRAEALVRAFDRFRASGKRVIVYAERTGNAGAWLGAQADALWMPPQGRLDLLGVRVEGPYVKSLLERIGVRPDVLSAGRYKSAGEMISRDGMSESAREALEPIVDGLYDTLVSGIAAGRGLTPEDVRARIDAGPFLAEEALENGLVDALLYPDEIPARLAGLAGTEGDARLIRAGAYARLFRRPRFSPLRGGTQIRVVPIQGMVNAATSSPQGIAGVLRRLEKDDSVCAVVLRVNSPGGDPLASDLIWRAVGKLGEAKPVVASFGDVAASGGYYVGMAASEIVAESTTLTGSIGVVHAGFDFEELAGRLGVSFDGIERGLHARIYDPFRRRTQEERALLRRQIHSIYSDFVRKAAEGRRRDERELEQVAQGRVWTGREAHARGLVDHLGGLEVAIDRARALAGVGAEGGEVRFDAPDRAGLLRRLRGDAVGDSLDLFSGAQLLCPIRIPLL